MKTENLREALDVMREVCGALSNAKDDASAPGAGLAEMCINEVLRKASDLETAIYKLHSLIVKSQGGTK